jgi:hypothetical protein
MHTGIPTLGPAHMQAPRIATTLESQFPEAMTAQPDLLAHHCGEADLTEKAVGYWLKAGQQAVARSAMTEAVAQLRRGLELLASMPDGADHEQRELELQAALVPAVIAAKGYTAPEVGETILGLDRSPRSSIDPIILLDCSMASAFCAWFNPSSG